MSGPYRTAMDVELAPRRRTLRGKLRSFWRRVQIWWATNQDAYRRDSRFTLIWDVGSRRLRIGTVAIEEIRYIGRGPRSIWRHLWISHDGIIWRHSESGERAKHERRLEEIYESAKFRKAARGE